MADANANGMCEEPDADFFDTFFDDGVLETIGEVYAEQKSDDVEESSCDSVEEITGVSSQSTEGSHQKLIILKPAQIQDPGKCPKDITSSSKNKSCPIISDGASATTSFGFIQRNALKQLTEFHNDCSSPELKKADSQSSERQSSIHIEKKQQLDPEQSISMEELLAKVKKILKEKPTSNEISKDEALKSNNHGEVKNINELPAAINSTPDTLTTSKTEVPREDRDEKSDSKRLSSEPSPSTNSLPSSVQINLSSDTVIEQTITEDEEEGELKEDSVPSSCILSTSNGSVSATKNTISNVKTIKSKDEAEKENDLTLEKTFPKSDDFQPLPEKKKIPINLKSQLLASTTTLNVGSASKSKDSSTSQNKKRESSLLSKEIFSSISSLSDASDPNGQRREKDKKRKRKGCSSDSESSDSGRHIRNSEERRKRSKRKKKRDVSPLSRRRKDAKKSKFRRSRSRSPYSSHRRKMSPKRSRYNRQRTASRSPVPYRGRKSPSPSVNRRRRSRSRARSRSRSPFINEISRLKKQWEMEDEAKKSSSRHLHPAMPLMGSWPGENTNATSTTIVSNLLSVSGDSVQVHSTSFTSIEAQGYHGYSTSLSPSFGPNHYAGAPILRPEYTACNNGDPYSGFLSRLPIPSQALVPGAILQLPDIPGLDTTIPPPMIQAAPEKSHHGPAQPPTSVLRKQLDILKSTVASLPEPCISPNKLGGNSAHASTNISEQVTLMNSISPSTPPKNCTTTRNDENLTQVVVIPETSCNTSDCLPQSLLSEKDSGHQSLSSNPKDKVGLQQLEDEVTIVQTSNETKVEAPGLEDTQGGDSDPDIIIEEPPPKPPVELICLSPDEGDGGSEGDGGNRCDKGNGGDEGASNLYDLDKELDKIDKDIQEKDATRTSAEKVNTSRTLDKSSDSGTTKRRKRKRSKRSHSKKKEGEEKKTDRKTTRKERACGEGTDLNDTQNPVVKECLEMIDTLRIGRFVVDTNTELELVNNQDIERSNSALRNRPISEFLYSKKPNLEVISATRNVATNTITQLCIDVCTSTDNTVIQKDAIVQTNFKCSGCIQKTDLIEEMKAKILRLEKERDDLQAKLKTQSIPGLDPPSGLNVVLSTKESPSSITSRANLINSQSSKSSLDSPNATIYLQSTDNFPSTMTDQDDRPFNESQRRNKSGEPVVAFEYHHQSPYLHSPF